MKRGFDILVSGTLLILLAPVVLACALWVRADSPGPAFYRQVRVGRGGRPFGMLKLRSMVVDAERIGGHATLSGDPRITRAGRILRRTSLDELPQLWNVVKGDMSLVGPRPDVPAQEADYAPADWRKRVSVRPGLTGPAQAGRRSALTPDERLRLDLAYVDDHSLAGDIGILWRTATGLLRSNTT